MSDCRRCPARLVWARTAANKAIPLDADDAGQVRTYAPDEARANVAVRADGGRLVARVLRKGEMPLGDEVRAMPHFATCPGWTR